LGRELCPFGAGELGPHLKQCGLGQGLPPYQPSGILIHPTVWLQYTNVTDRQTGQTDNGRPKIRSNSAPYTGLTRPNPIPGQNC